MQQREDCIIQDRRGHEIAQVVELDALAIEENIHSLVGSGQKIAVNVQRLLRMGGRDTDEPGASRQRLR